MATLDYKAKTFVAKNTSLYLAVCAASIFVVTTVLCAHIFRGIDSIPDRIDGRSTIVEREQCYRAVELVGLVGSSTGLVFGVISRIFMDPREKIVRIIVLLSVIANSALAFVALLAIAMLH